MLNRRLLMAQAGAEPPSGGIVMDGLVFRLDGNNRGEEEGYWIDTVGHRRMKLYGYKEGENHIELLSPGGYMRQERGPTLLSGSQWTCDFALQAESGRAMLASNGAGKTPINIGYQGTSLWLSTIRMPGYALQLTDKLPHTLSISARVAYTDKKQMDRIGTDAWGFVANGLTIGGRGDTPIRDKLIGKIFEVRIYDRQLTDAEMLQNQQHDIDTYFGGVVPE